MPLEDQQGTEVDTLSPGTADIGGSTDTTDSTPPSSSGTDTDAPTGPASLEDAISAALEADADANPEAKTPDADADAKEDADDKADTDPDTSDGTVENGSQGEDDEITDEEIAGLRPKAQKRVRQLLSQRNEARRQVETFKGDATSYQQIRQFMATNQLVDADVADLFKVGADLKSGNPERVARALDRMLPLVQQAMEITGRTLPNDLQQQVENGEMTEAAARQMAQTRTQAAFAQQQAQQAQQQVQAQQTQAAQTQILSAVDQWTQQIRQTDPDFDLKADAMKRVAQALVAERGLPKTPAQAVEYAKAAHAEASKWMKSARPAPKPSRPAPTSQTAPRSGLAPTATSLEAIIAQALEG